MEKPLLEWAHFKEEQLRQLEEEHRARERILREAIDPQVRQAQEIVAQVQASLVRVAREITTAVAGGAAVSPATRRSWGSGSRRWPPWRRASPLSRLSST
jgi:hypothetical protein